MAIFVVSFSSVVDLGTASKIDTVADDLDGGVMFQRFDRNGNFVDGLKRINNAYAGVQSASDVAMDADSDAYFAWSGAGANDTSGVFTRRHGYSSPQGNTTSVTDPANTTESEILLGTSFTGPTESLGYALGGVVNGKMFENTAVSGSRLKYKYNPDQYGSAEITIKGTDLTEGLPGESVIVIRRLQSNASPILGFIRNRAATEGQGLTFTATAEDKFGTIGNLEYSVVAGPGAIGKASGVYTYTPPDGGVTVTNPPVTIRVTDPANLEWTQETFTIVVDNVRPTARFTSQAGLVITPNTSPVFAFDQQADVAADLGSLTYAFDVDGNPATWEVSGSTPYLAVDAKYFPTSAAGTVRTIRGRVTDKDGGTSIYPITVNIENVNGNSPLPPTASVVVNNGQAQRSNVTSITVTFDQSVAFPGTAFTLTKQGSAGTVPLNVTLNGNVATITFVPDLAWTQTTLATPSLRDGVYTFTIVGANVVGAAGPMAGNTTLTFKRLFGDFNGDGTVDGGSDFANFRFITQVDNPFDINGDGVVDGGTDFAEFGTRFGRTI